MLAGSILYAILRLRVDPRSLIANATRSTRQHVCSEAISIHAFPHTLRRRGKLLIMISSKRSFTSCRSEINPCGPAPIEVGTNRHAPACSGERQSVVVEAPLGARRRRTLLRRFHFRLPPAHVGGAGASLVGLPVPPPPKPATKIADLGGACRLSLHRPSSLNRAVRGGGRASRMTPGPYR